jgi:hypothetical protein
MGIEYFLKKSRDRFGDKYDYSLITDYKNCKQTVKIICPIHGVFDQIAELHYNSKTGCPTCSSILKGKEHRMKREEFVEKANDIHKNKYEYKDTVYVTGRTKVSIICPSHGNFQQNPETHLQGTGCPKCSGRLSLGDLIKDANEIYDNKYDYIMVNTTNRKETIEIKCDIHTSFQTTWGSHIGTKRVECPKCKKVKRDDIRKERLQEKLIRKGREIHFEKYDYSLVKYEEAKKDVVIICPSHGPYPQTPSNHLKGEGCLQCGNENKYVGVNEKDYFGPFLQSMCEKLHFTIEPQKQIIDKCEGKRIYYCVDFYIPEINLVIEYDEDHHYRKEHLAKDKIREEYIRNNLGCDVVRIDDKTFMNDNTYAKIKLCPYLGRSILKTSIEDLFE